MKKDKVIFFVIILYSLFFSINEKIIECALTVISIIFGFSIAYLCAIYTNEKLNVVLKRNKQLDVFLNSNKEFLLSMLNALIGIFLCGIIENKQYMWKFNINVLDMNLNFCILFQLYLVVALWTMYIFFLAQKNIQNFLIVYKNSYSDYLQKVIKREKNDK